MIKGLGLMTDGSYSRCRLMTLDLRLLTHDSLTRVLGDSCL